MGFSVLNSLLLYMHMLPRSSQTELTPGCLARFALCELQPLVFKKDFLIFLPCRNAASLFINRLDINAGGCSGAPTWGKEGNGL